MVMEKYPNILDEIERFILVETAVYALLCYKNNFKEEYKVLIDKLRLRIKRNLKNPKIKLKWRVKTILIGYLGFARFYRTPEI